MPTYEYACPSGHHFERLGKMTDKGRAKCPTCGRMATRRISGGAGLVFKGSGFYITDYGKDGKGPRKGAEAERGEAKSAEVKGAEAKSGEGKRGEPKPDGESKKESSSSGAKKASE